MTPHPVTDKGLGVPAMSAVRTGSRFGRPYVSDFRGYAQAVR
jgi:hypothetical protein